MDKNICHICGTHNETEYVYCKNCGTQLKPENNFKAENFYKTGSLNSAAPNNDQTGNGYSTGNSDSICIDGIPSDEISLFVGSKANKILPKFIKMELTHSKVSWCWPAAVLGYLFGPIGAALWFFYRKNYKPAVILSVIGAIITIVTFILNPNISQDTLTVIDNALTNYDFQTILQLFNSLEPSVIILFMVYTFIEGMSSILTCVLCGIFGYHWYKTNCISKIYEYRALQADQRYYSLGLAAIGGVSGGMLTLGIIIMFSLNMILNFITAIIEIIL